MAQLLKRPEIAIEQLVPALLGIFPSFFERNTDHWPLTTGHLSSEIRNELKSVETEIKYAGYLDQQQRAIDRLKKAEQRRIPDWFDYRAVSGLSREMQEKLGKVVPQTLGQASRIPGVTPAAVSLINVYIEIQASTAGTDGGTVARRGGSAVCRAVLRLDGAEPRPPHELSIFSELPPSARRSAVRHRKALLDDTFPPARRDSGRPESALCSLRKH